MTNHRLEFWDDTLTGQSNFRDLAPTHLDTHPALGVLGLLSGLLPDPLLKTIGKRWQSLKICCWHIDIKHRELWSRFRWQRNSKNAPRGDYYRVPMNKSALSSVWTHLSPRCRQRDCSSLRAHWWFVGRVRSFPGFVFSTVCGFQQDVVLMSQHTKVIVWQGKKALVPREWSWWMKPGKSAIWLKTSVESVHIRGYYTMVRCDSLTWYLLRSLRYLWAGPLWRQARSYRKYKSLPALNDNYVFNQEILQ